MPLSPVDESALGKASFFRLFLGRTHRYRSAGRRRMNISQLLAFRLGVERQICISPDLPPIIRVNGGNRRIDVCAIQKDVGHMVYDTMNDSQRKVDEEFMETKFSFETSLPGARLRQRLQSNT